jgi:TolA-binding protein
MRMPFVLRPLVLGLAVWAGAGASQAALFEDSDARRAILELRQRFDAAQQVNQRSAEELTQLRRSLLDLQTQIETLRAEQAKLNGQNEQLLRDVGELQRRQKDLAQGVDERLRQFEPIKVTVDGREFQADPAEKRDFEAALAVFRSGKFPDASVAFAAFVRQYPRSGYVPSARFWLGNAQYATREYKEAIGNFKQMLTEAPTHARAPEAD